MSDSPISGDSSDVVETTSQVTTTKVIGMT